MVIHAGDPVRVGAVNVGLRGLPASSAGVVQLLQQTCCDVLFLSDLRTTRGKIGRPRRTIEAALRDEWRLLTDISESGGRPVGMGALIHASLALHAEQLKIDRPADVLEPHWRAAADGRVLRLQIKRPLAPKVGWIVGIYQHVAKAAKAEKRKIGRAHV